MRKIFVNTLMELCAKDERIFLLTGDMGFSVFETFREKFPRRFFNMGVAEQNMVGVSAGLALSGKIPFVYSIIPFLTMRPFEQIRNDLCFQNLNVRLVGIGAGLTYGPAGATHHALEDIAIMRSLPNMTVLAPGDAKETEMCVRLSISHEGPVYIRLCKANPTPIHSAIDFKIGKGIVITEGADVTIIASGSMLFTANLVSGNLKKNGLSVRFVSMPSIKPLDKKVILDSSKKTPVIVTIEEHSQTGGLGSAVSEVLAESGCNVVFKRLALSDKCKGLLGSQAYLLKKHGLSEERLTKTILAISRKAAR